MAGGDETRRKLLAAVLLVGGGLTIPGGPLHLQARLQASETVERRDVMLRYCCRRRWARGAR